MEVAREPKNFIRTESGVEDDAAAMIGNSSWTAWLFRVSNRSGSSSGRTLELAVITVVTHVMEIRLGARVMASERWFH
jgi:hypothetical protein